MYFAVVSLYKFICSINVIEVVFFLAICAQSTMYLYVQTCVGLSMKTMMTPPLPRPLTINDDIKAQEDFVARDREIVKLLTTGELEEAYHYLKTGDAEECKTDWLALK